MQYMLQNIKSHSAASKHLIISWDKNFAAIIFLVVVAISETFCTVHFWVHCFPDMKIIECCHSRSKQFTQYQTKVQNVYPVLRMNV